MNFHILDVSSVTKDNFLEIDHLYMSQIQLIVYDFLILIHKLGTTARCNQIFVLILKYRQKLMTMTV